MFAYFLPELFRPVGEGSASLDEEDSMDINARVEKLERENRRMKKIGIVAAVVVSTFIIGGQAKTNKVVEANEFRLLDSSRKVRALLSMSASGGPELTFNDASGDFVVALSTTPAPSLTLRPIGTGESVYLHAGTTDSPNASLGLGLPPKSVLIVAGSHNAIDMFGSAGTFRVNLDEDLGGPRIAVTDKEGYSLNLGRVDVAFPGTGQNERTPAASLVLFGKDKKVMWSAP